MPVAGLFLLFLILPGEVVSDSISGTITDNVTFFYRKLSSVASKVATLEYEVWYLNRSVLFKRLL